MAGMSGVTATMAQHEAIAKAQSQASDVDDPQYRRMRERAKSNQRADLESRRAILTNGLVLAQVQVKAYEEELRTINAELGAL